MRKFVNRNKCNSKIMKFFNTAGSNKPDIHYTLNPLSRWNLEEIVSLIQHEKYFVLHAPRQTGKTSCMLSLMDYLNNTGGYKALYINVEAARAARENTNEALKAICYEIANRMKFHLQDNFLADKISTTNINYSSLNSVLSDISVHFKQPFILFIDEIDSLIGDTLISVLRQLRSGYDKRPASFPRSVILCGVRDVRDYRIHSTKEKTIITGGSAYNIKTESLRIGNFSYEEIKQLYLLHTKETGQKFDDNIWNTIMDYTGGQPWLVNALAYETCFRQKEGKDRNKTITLEMIDRAKENLIIRRDTHLDQLIDKLEEPRVHRVIQPILAGKELAAMLEKDDIQYVEDLGGDKTNTKSCL